MAELCSNVEWKVEIVRNELDYLAEEISKQNVESTAWFVLSPLVKCERKKDRLREELLSKKEPIPDDLENPPAYPRCKLC